MLSEMACIMQLHFVFYSTYLACQTQKIHTPSKGSFHVSMMKRAGSFLHISDGRASQGANSVVTIRRTTDTLQDLFINAPIVVHNSERQQGLYLRTAKFPCLIGSLL